MPEENVRKRRGRPPLPTERVRRHAIAIRTTKSLVDRLKQAGEASGRSLAREIEHRLERSFEVQTTNYDDLIERLAEMKELAQASEVKLGALARELKDRPHVFFLHGPLGADGCELLVGAGWSSQVHPKPVAPARDLRSRPAVFIVGSHDVGADVREWLAKLVGGEIDAKLLSEFDDKDPSRGTGER
jgi:hypothetical protein